MGPNSALPKRVLPRATMGMASAERRGEEVEEAPGMTNKAARMRV